MPATVQPLSPHRTSGTPLPQGSVLVVDDDEQIRTLFLDVFQPHGLVIRVAGSGQEALAMLEQAPASLLIVDVALPDQDGITVLEQAHQMDPRITGVVMTGAATVELAVRAMKAGANDFLIKPVNIGGLLATARRLLDLHERRSEQTVLKCESVRTGVVRLRSIPLPTFEDHEAPDGQDASPAQPGPTDYERGLSDGERLAVDRMAAQARHERIVLAEAVRRFAETQAALQHTLETQLIAVGFQIATKVLRGRAEDCKAQIITQAKAAIAALKEPCLAVIQVHPDDVETLEGVKAGLAERCDIAVTLQIEAVPTLSRGACLLRTSNRLIDASLDTQLLLIGEALNKRTRHGSR